MTHDEFEQALEALRAQHTEQVALLREQADLLRQINLRIKEQARTTRAVERRIAR